MQLLLFGEAEIIKLFALGLLVTAEPVASALAANGVTANIKKDP